MFSFQKSVLLVLSLALTHPPRASAEQILRVFAVSPAQFSTPENPYNPTMLSPIYGGSDPTGFVISFNGSGDLIPILNFELPNPVDAQQDAIEGSIDCPNYSDCALILSAGDGMKSTIENPGKVSATMQNEFASYQPFRLSVPKGFVSGQLTLSFQSPKVISGGQSKAAFANVRLVRGGATTTPSAPQAIPRPESAPVMDDSSNQVVRQFSGNDFDSHVLSSWTPHDPTPLLLHTCPDGVTADVNVTALNPRIIPILALDDPPITQPHFAISGDVAYGGVAGQNEVDGFGYLEMWSDFAGGSSYFTRTLAGSGLLHEIRGRSGPRRFLLPFNSADKRPTRLRMNLVMTGRGTVSMTNLKLVQYVPPTITTAIHNQTTVLFNPRLLFIPVMVLPFFALVSLLEPLVRRGKGRTFVMIWIGILFVLAQLSFAWGMAALGHGLSFRQVSPMLLVSGLILGCTLFAGLRMSRRYRDAELNRMRLMDLV